MNESPNIFEVIDLDTFTALLARLQRKAKRLHLPIPEMKILGEEVRTQKLRFEGKAEINLSDPNHGQAEERQVMVTRVEISNLEPVRLNGWEFAASIEGSEGGNFLRSVPGVELPERFRTSDANACEHCKTNRNRKEVFIVRHAERNEWKQVGRQCLANFTSSENAGSLAERFAFHAEAWQLLHEGSGEGDEFWGEGGGRAREAWDLVPVVAVTIGWMDKYGWLSATKAKEVGQSSTGMQVLSALTSPKQPRPVPTPENLAKAEEAVEWAKVLEPRDGKALSDYEHNLRLLATNGFCTRKSFGLACSIPVAWGYASARRVARERERLANANRTFLGEVGKRVTWKGLVVTKVIHFETDWGAGQFTFLEDEAGNVIKAKAVSGCSPEPGDVFESFTATIKAHETYRETPQTCVLRAKGTLRPEAPEPEIHHEPGDHFEVDAGRISKVTGNFMPANH